jgi:hypothetical protein
MYLVQKNKFSSVTADFVTFQGKHTIKILDIFSTMNKYSATLSHILHMEFA